MAKKFDKLLEKATDATLVEADWEMIMNCVDCVRSGEVPPKLALAAVRKRYHVNNPHVCHHALLILEALVKNCGDKFHKEIATKECMEDLKHLAAESSEKVKEKVLELIQCWAHAFREKSEYKIVFDTHSLMKLEGFTFPAFREADAMFAAEVAPEWVDSDTCYRCKASFTLLNRKHHCRNCGQIFCDKCSSRYIPLPHIGIEKDVRVCETCFDKLLKNKPAEQPNAVAVAAPNSDDTPQPKKGATASEKPKSIDGKPDEMTREEEELQLALAISQSEAEEKERQRQRALVQMYNGPGAPNQEISSIINGGLGYKGVMDSTPAPASAADPSDNELARYLNRDYWDQRRVEQKAGILRQSPTPSAPSSDSSPILGTADNGVSSAPSQGASGGHENAENGIGEPSKHGINSDQNFAQFAQTLRSTVDAFINRIRSDQMRGRSILGDGNVQTMFMTLTNMHSQLLKHLNELDDRRGYFESLQDKLAQIQDAREAIEALRDEHEQHRRAELLEQQRQRQHQMFAKLGVMRQKKHEMLEQQRLLALQRMEEERRHMEQRKQMQQQASMMARFAAPGTPGVGTVQQAVSYGNVQQPGQGVYYGPGGVPIPNPYEMHQMAASLPNVMHQQPPSTVPPMAQVPNYGSPYHSYQQAQFPVSAATQIPSTFPSQTMGNAQQTAPQQQGFYQTPYTGHQPAGPQPPQPTVSYYPTSPSHPASVPPGPQQQVVYTSSVPGGYSAAVPAGAVPQYVMAPTVATYDGQQQHMPPTMMYQQQQQMQQPLQQQPQPIPEAQLISFD